jgi:hypothetical protein
LQSSTFVAPDELPQAKACCLGVELHVRALQASDGLREPFGGMHVVAFDPAQRGARQRSKG